MANSRLAVSARRLSLVQAFHECCQLPLVVFRYRAVVAVCLLPPVEVHREPLGGTLPAFVWPHGEAGHVGAET